MSEENEKENYAFLDDDEDTAVTDTEEEGSQIETFPIEDNTEVQRGDDLSDEALNQGESLEGTAALGVDAYSTVSHDGEAEMNPDDVSLDKDIQLTDMVDSSVQAIENGIDENVVLGEASERIADFYETQIEQGMPVDDMVNSIADTVHEIASVFDVPSDAAVTMLNGIDDTGITESVMERIEDVHADMTVEATGTFGEIEYDDTGNVIDNTDPLDNVVDIGGLIKTLENHMESAVDTPEMQDVLAEKQDQIENIDSVVDSVDQGWDTVIGDDSEDFLVDFQ